MPVARAFIVIPVLKIGHVHLKCFVTKKICGKMLTPRTYGAASESTHSTVCTLFGAGLEHSQPMVRFGAMMLLIEMSHVVTRLEVDSPLL